MIIRTELALEIQEYDKRLLGYTASMSYNYAQLCVIADPSSLLPLEIEVGGDTKHIEEVANCVVHQKDGENGDNITIDIYPNSPIYITAIMEAVKNYHPEMKQTLEDIRDQSGNEDMKEFFEEHKDEVDEEMELKCKYIRLVMPDVNKDRRDLLLKLVDAYREALNANFKAMRVKTEASLVPLVAGVPKDEVDAVYEKMDDTYKRYVEMADNLTEDKKQQIDDAYQEHIKLHPEDAVNKVQPEESGTQSLKLDW